MTDILERVKAAIAEAQSCGHTRYEELSSNALDELLPDTIAEVERPRNLPRADVTAYDRRIQEMAARIKELDADRIAYRNLGSRIEDLETYIERLEAAFLEVTEAFEWEGIDGDMNRDDCRKRAREALERIKAGGKDD